MVCTSMVKTTIRTYAELQRAVEHFASTASNIILVGEPGLAKTSIVKQAINGSGRHLDGNLSAFEFYKLLYQHQDELFVLDDVDSLYGDRAFIRLLKQACQTTPVKTVSWRTRHSDIGDEGVPSEFETTSRFVIIANDWRTLNRNVAAIEDRGILIHFAPSPEDIHRYVETWFDDREVLDFVWNWIPYVSTVSARLYITASQLREGNLDWRRTVLDTMGIDNNTQTLVDLQALDLPTEKKVEEYTRLTGRSRATYFRDLNKLLERRNRRLSGDEEPQS